MKRNLISILFMTLAFCFFIDDLPSIYAQEEEFTLEEITVTAQKMEQDLQDTAISMDVVGGTEIREKGSVDLFDALREVTNLQLTEVGTGAGPTISIRGLGQDFPPELGEPAVAMNIDGAIQMNTQGTEFGLFDIERIEVLRGPQGTLYGRNSTGGVVNIISTKPKIGVIEGFVNFDIGAYDKMKGAAVINIPISDHFAGRLAMAYGKQDSSFELSDGWRKRQNSWSARMQLRYEPTDDAYVNLQTTYNETEGGKWSRIAWDNWRAGIYINTQDNALVERTSLRRRENIKAVLNAAFPLGPGVVTIIPTYEHEVTHSASLATDRRTGEVDYSQGINVGAALDQVTYNVEARYSSKPDSRVTWLGGIFYAKDDHPGRTFGNNPVDVIGWYTYKAAFGQITYPFSDTFRLVAGLRREQDQKYRESVAYTPMVRDLEFSYTDWKVGIEKDFREELMAYFTVATGHRSGGYDRAGGEFKTESSISGEVGMKSRWLYSRLQLNGAIFYYDYSDYQVTDNWEQYDIDEGRIVRIEKFFNCDKAVNYGAEIEMDLLIGDATQLNISMAYLNATYQADYFPHLTADILSTVSQKGADLPHSPDLSVNTSINHRFKFSNGAYLTPRVSAKYTGGQYIGVLPTSDFYQDATTIVDFYLNFQSTQNWSLNFYATNIFDKIYATGIGGRDAYFPGERRMVGCTLDIPF